MFNSLDFVCFRLNNNIPEILLRRREKENEPAHGEFALIGGWIWENTIEDSDIVDCDINDAQKRIIEQKIGLKPSHVEKVDTIGNNWRDPRGWSITVLHLCFFNTQACEELGNNDNMKWVPVNEIIDGEQVGKRWIHNNNSGITLPFDHNLLVKTAYKLLVNRFSYSSMLLLLLPEEFTVKDIMEASQSFGINMNKTTAVNRWVKSNLVTDTGRKCQQKRQGQCPALYKSTETDVRFFDVSLGRTK